MDLRDNLMKSKRHMGKASIFSICAHALLVVAIFVIGARASHTVDAEDRQIRAFITTNAAPPPPPPPPPPAPASQTPQAPRVQPRVQPTPVQPSFVAPVEIPKEIPVVETIPSDLTPSAGGVVGGVVGGVQGGVVGGVLGGEIGGVQGGEIGGVPGGTVGGTGTEAAPSPAPPPPPPPPPPVEPPDEPVRVGGNVKAPIAVKKFEPEYTNTARAGRVTGVVIIEAIIDKHGNVDRVKVIKGLPMGLSEAAERAVRQWKFRPGTQGGEAVDVIFNLTVTFKLD
jgi:protein TonB